MATIELKKIDSKLIQKTIILTCKEAVDIAGLLLAQLGDTNIRNNQIGACPNVRLENEIISFSVSTKPKDEQSIREIIHPKSAHETFFIFSKEVTIELILEFTRIIALKQGSYDLKGYRVSESNKTLGTLCFKVI